MFVICLPEPSLQNFEIALTKYNYTNINTNTGNLISRTEKVCLKYFFYSQERNYNRESVQGMYHFETKNTTEKVNCIPGISP